MPVATPPPPPSAAPRDWPVYLVPVGLAVVGALLRYAAYTWGNAHPTAAGFASAMCVWDCYWYGDVALNGYQAHPENLNFGGPGGIANWAFFPAYPLILGALQRVTGAAPGTVGAILSPLLTLGAAICAWSLFDGKKLPYFLFAALLLAGPFSFYFATAYSESLFLLLTVLAFGRLKQRQYLAAGIAGAFLSATRTVGVLFVFALVTEVAIDFRRRLLPGLSQRPDIVLAVLLVPLGLFAFMAWLYFVSGDALAFFHIQRGWDRESVSPALALWAAFTSPEGQVKDAPLLAVASLGGLGLCGVLVWRREFPAAIFCTLSLLLALTSGVESMLRFVAALAPLGVVLCQLLAKWRWSFWISLLAFIALDFWFTLGWLHQRGALM
jgi:hypothetical protein